MASGPIGGPAFSGLELERSRGFSVETLTLISSKRLLAESRYRFSEAFESVRLLAALLGCFVMLGSRLAKCGIFSIPLK